MNLELVKGIDNRTSYQTTNTTEFEVFSNVGWGIGKKYMDGGTNIHIHIRFDTEEYCAIFDRACEVFDTYSIGACPFHEDFLTENSSGEQKVAMLIGVAEHLEIPEVFQEVILPCVVTRLKRIDNRYYCVGHPLELAPLYSFVFTNSVKDGKLGSTCGFISFGEDELPDKMVKGAPEVVEHLSKSQSDIIGEGRYILEAIECISRINVLLFCDTIYIRVGEGEQLSAQSITFFSGPVQFSKRAFKGGHSDTLQENSEDSKGLRDTHTGKGGVRAQSEEGRQVIA
ncbi:MAG TPA: hypothetical protein G4O10_06730 [Dehalococcoidia bacterium]|nr:hypothetical protein [Dehalococcoidia bacterium]